MLFRAGCFLGKDFAMVDEPIDVYDENHRYLGIAMKSEAHAKKLWHETFHCWITTIDPEGDLAVLLQLRSHLKEECPSFLSTSAAGHLQAGEQLKDGVREVEEELGIPISFQKVIPLYQFQEKKAAEFISVYGYHHSDSLKKCILQESEVDGLFYAKTKDVTALFAGLKHQIPMRDYKTDKIHFTDINHFVDFSGLYYIEGMKRLELLHQKTELIQGIKFGNLEQFAAVWAKSEMPADKPLLGLKGNTLVHLAAYNKQPNHLKLLLESLPVDRKLKVINKANDMGVTPLHEAVLIGPNGDDFKKENSSATSTEIQQVQEIFNRQCVLMPQITDYLIKQGADSFFEKAVYMGPEQDVSISEYLDLMMKKPVLTSNDSQKKKAFQTTKEIIQNRINSQKSLFKLFGREER